MAATDRAARAHDPDVRRRPFSSWVKRLAGLKGSSAYSHTNRWHKRNAVHNGKKANHSKDSPYSLTESDDRDNPGPSSLSDPSVAYSGGHGNQARSTAPTVSTNGDTYSKTGTLATAGGGLGSMGGGEGSTFSSPAPSVRSLTTTLTTVQSAAAISQIQAVGNSMQNGQHSQVGGLHINSTQQVQFSHQFPSSPVSAVPSYIGGLHGHSSTYGSATANNLLTDNASILTLASSSKRRRRNSLDTNASIRALAPSSIFGGSRESLPLSVLSGGTTAEPSAVSAQGANTRSNLAGLASVERGSVYSASGVVALSSGGERASIHVNKQGSVADGASIRSDIHSHVRNDSATGSINGGIGGTFANACPGVTQPTTTGRVSRTSSGWGEITGNEGEEGQEGEEKQGEEIEKEKSPESKQDASFAEEKERPEVRQSLPDGAADEAGPKLDGEEDYEPLPT